jgi:hypothetical protein
MTTHRSTAGEREIKALGGEREKEGSNKEIGGA